MLPEEIERRKHWSEYNNWVRRFERAKWEVHAPDGSVHIADKENGLYLTCCYKSIDNPIKSSYNSYKDIPNIENITCEGCKFAYYDNY